ncbi:MAG: hypothetical protein C5B54_00230 [Acidobacteria bacterium]|nr:MAG: hypothetical protein C5B54_00230 [Acidobacteriota bacterium]
MLEGLWIVLLFVAPQNIGIGQNFAQIGSFRVNIINETEAIGYATVLLDKDLGPQVGNILNAHYFPGLNYYQAGNYRYAYNELVYVIDRPTYLAGNPNQANYLSTAYYSRGMIFAHHALGVGHLSLAKVDFENALRWNPSNYLVYLELSRVYSSLGFRDQAILQIQRLLTLQPDEKIAEEARNELKLLMEKPKFAGDGQSLPNTTNSVSP